MLKEQMVVGGLVVVLCVTGLLKDRWFLANTKKGRKLVGWFGESKALWVLRGLFVGGAVLGLLLATNVIRPVQW